MDFSSEAVSIDRLLRLYRGMLLPRLVEEKMLTELRKGKISKWFSGIGQEAIAAGATQALESDDFILPLIRNLGVFVNRDVSLQQLFEQFQGKPGGFTKGRDRSFHFGTLAHHIVGMISHLGPQLGVATGIGLSHKISGEPRVTLAFTGDGATSEGDFHEALNVAAVWQLPVIFLIENNAYGLSTPVREQYACDHLVDRASGYGMRGYQIDGNNVVEVYETVSNLAQELRESPEPVLVECMTFRMRGHEEASGTKYVPRELFDYWGERDPITNMAAYLKQTEILTEAQEEHFQQDFKQQIQTALQAAYAAPDVSPDPEEELKDVYHPHDSYYQPFSAVQDTHDFQRFPAHAETQEQRFIGCISEGLWQSMEQYPELVLMGQDIAEYGGAFKVTEGFVAHFGKERVRNTPLCESAIIGAGMGLSLNGHKAMVEMQFADFVSMGVNQIANNLAKLHYRWGANADVVIRMPTGGGSGAGPFHSQSTEGWFTHTPGLKVVYPATPTDAKGLLNAAIEDPNPVMYFEHKALYRSQVAQVYSDYYTIAIGKARIVREGKDLSIITYGAGVHWALEALDEQPAIDGEVVDLRTLLPWDKASVMQSVAKTGKALILEEATETGSFGATVVSYISEHGFEYLDGPVTRVASLDTPVPFNKSLEDVFLAKHRLPDKLARLAAY
jgi:2-oxoisovalerate dehydrogenase E1 component